jgi:hypothetical protein
MPPQRDSHPQSLYRIVWGGKKGHWGLFLPDDDRDLTHGLLVHIGVESDKRLGGSSRGKEHHTLMFEPIDVGHTRGAITRIKGARATTGMLQEAANATFIEGGGYNYVYNNCQHFCLNLIKKLHQLYPTLVTSEAVADAQSNATAATVASNAVKAIIQRSGRALYSRSGKK